MATIFTFTKRGKREEEKRENWRNLHLKNTEISPRFGGKTTKYFRKKISEWD
jgi:hypothetical protein